jgi:hypothetical protein
MGEKGKKVGNGYPLIHFFCALVILEKEYLYNKRRQTCEVQQVWTVKMKNLDKR